MDDGQPVVTVVKEKGVSPEKVVRLFLWIFLKQLELNLKKPRKTKDKLSEYMKTKIIYIFAEKEQ